MIVERTRGSQAVLGTVCHANDKGFYWIRRDDGGQDVFLGDKQLEIDGLMPLKVGTRLSFDITASRRGHRATNVRVA